MATTNPVTGDQIQTKGGTSDEFRKNYDKIFAKWEHFCPEHQRVVRLLVEKYKTCPDCDEEFKGETK